MNIKQAAEQSGVSSPNIRFYEKEGLMTPARNRGNAYRDYTAEDIRTLKLIRMLRMLDMPLPVIQRVLNGEQQRPLPARSRPAPAPCSPASSGRSRQAAAAPASGTGPD